MFNRTCKTSEQATHHAGRLTITVTEIRPDDMRRNEARKPEVVRRHIPLPLNATRATAFRRQAEVFAALSPSERASLRVKVVAR